MANDRGVAHLPRCWRGATTMMKMRRKVEHQKGYSEEMRCLKSSKVMEWSSLYIREETNPATLINGNKTRRKLENTSKIGILLV